MESVRSGASFSLPPLPSMRISASSVLFVSVGTMLEIEPGIKFFRIALMSICREKTLGIAHHAQNKSTKRDKLKRRVFLKTLRD